MTALPIVPAAIDPLAATHDGVYRDGLVEVRAHRGAPDRRQRGMVRTASFDVAHVGARLHVTHRLLPDEIDDDLSGRLADELFGPGWLRGADLFERLFTGVVLTSARDPVSAWLLFYRNSLARSLTGTLAPVHAHVESLLAPGSVLELGCCFGFLSLRLAAAGRTVTASDLDPGTVALLRAVAPRLGIALDTVAADAAAYPCGSRSFDTVLLVHLLEHVDAATGARILAEAGRLARRRVVVAVPLEQEADETWGHVRTISLADLTALGTASGLRFDVHEQHGGWLVLDV